MKKINLKKEKWNKENYQEYLEYLISLKNDSYKQFHSKLVTTKYEILGIPLPMQRKLASTISQGDAISFLDVAGSIYYEEVLIRGLVLSSLKDEDVVKKYLEEYRLLVDNWAINDSFCNSFKIVNLDKRNWFNYFANYLKEDNEFNKRMALVIFLNFYVEEVYLPDIFKLIDEIDSEAYYVNMAEAWLLCECFIKYRDETLNYLKNCKINTFTFKKTISKIKDSYRVSLEDKNYLSNLKRSAI